MPSQLVYPGEYEVTGVFLLGRDELTELDSLLQEAKKEIDRYVRRQLNSEVNKRLKSIAELSQVDDVDAKRTEILAQTKEWHPFWRRKHRIAVVCRSKNTLEATSFAAIIESDGLKNEFPIEANVEIQNADSELRVHFFPPYAPNRIQISVAPNKAFAHKIGRQLREWAEAKRQVAWWPKLVFPVVGLGIMLLYACILLSSIGLFTVVSSKGDLLRRAQDLTQRGVDSTNQAQAIEMILRLQTDDFQETRFFDVKGWYIAVLLIGVGFLSFGLARPRSTLGIGRSVTRMNLYRFIIRKVKVSVGLWLAAIVASMLGAAAYDLISHGGPRP